MTFRRRARALRLAVLAALLTALVVGGTSGQPPASAASLSQLNSQLGSEQAHQHQLSGSIASLSGLISSLSRQIALVASREAAVREQLATDQARLASVAAALRRQRALVLRLRRRLAWARMLLSRQLVASYESDRPDLVSVVLDAHGFNQLLDQFTYLDDAEHQQQSIIAITRRAKQEADSAAARLATLQARDRQITDAVALQARALAGMNALLQSRQAALQRARYAQQLALRASQTRGRQLESQIAHIQAEQAAARAAAAAQAVPQAVGSPSAPAALGPNGGWVIPYAIVLCESGGQNLPPNSAGASGYYQIIPSTWSEYGGTGPAAYLTSKAEQDAVASRIWDGGRGASAWVCAGIVGIH